MDLGLDDTGFSCAVCGIAFANVALLQEHLVTHISEPVNSVSTEVFKKARKIPPAGLREQTSRKRDIARKNFIFTKQDGGESEAARDDRDNVVMLGSRENSLVSQQELPECMHVFSLEELDRNFKFITHNGRYVCDVGQCRYFCYVIDRMRTHIRSHSFCFCAVCSDGYFTIQSEQVFDACKKGKPNLCSKCNEQSFATVKSKRDDGKELSCPVCQWSGISLLDFKIHLDRHSGFEMFHCKLCPKTYGTKALVDLHERACMKRKVNDKVSCSECGCSFPSKSQLSTHKLQHAKERRPYEKFECPQCPLKLKKKRWYEKHLMTHPDGCTGDNCSPSDVESIQIQGC